MFNKIPYGTYLLFWLKTKIKYLLFWFKTKIPPKILLLLLKKCVFGLDPGKIPGSGSVKNESGSATLLHTYSILDPRSHLEVEGLEELGAGALGQLGGPVPRVDVLAQLLTHSNYQF